MRSVEKGGEPGDVRPKRSPGRPLGTAPFSPGAFGVFIKMRALPDGRLAAYYERGLVEGAQSRIPDSQERVVELLSAEAKPVRILYEKRVRASRLAWNADYEAYVRVPFPYHPAIAMEVLPSGAVVAGLNDKYEFEILDPDRGRLRTFSRPWTPVRITFEGAPLDSNFAVSPSNRFSGATLWRIERDKDEYPSLVKYRLAAAQ